MNGPTPIARELFRRKKFSGNPPRHPYRYGWQVSLGGRASPLERTWLKAHGYQYSGHSWYRADRVLELAPTAE